MAPPVVELERVEQSRFPPADLDRLEPAVLDDEQGDAVRLHQVGLVDAGLLDVRARVVDALLGGRTRRRRIRPARPHRDAGRMAEAIRAGEPGRLRLHITEQVWARAKGEEATVRRRGCLPADATDERGRQDHRDGETDAVNHCARYTTPRAAGSQAVDGFTDCGSVAF